MDPLFNNPAGGASPRSNPTELGLCPRRMNSACALTDPPPGRPTLSSKRPRLHMRPMVPQELDAYIASGLWQGKAGAYGVQDHDDAFVTHLDGSFSNVVGLPVKTVAAALARRGIHPCDPASA